MMNIRKAFENACSLVRTDESLANRQFTITTEGKLYFKGDLSNFMVTDFVKVPYDIILSYTDMMALVSLDGDITAEQSPNRAGSVSFSNGENTLLLNGIPSSVVPDITIYQETEYIGFGSSYVGARSIYSLASDKSITASFFEAQTGSHCIAVLGTSVIGLSVGSNVQDMDLTEIPDIMRNSIMQKAKVKVDNSRLFFYSEVGGVTETDDDTTTTTDPDHTIYNTVAINPSVIASRSMDNIISMISKTFEDETGGNGDVVTGIIDGVAINKIIPIIEKLKFNNKIIYRFNASDGKMYIEVEDQHFRKFKGSVLGEISNDLKFRSIQISKDMLTFISEAVGGINKAAFRFSVNINEKKMVVRREPKDNEEIKVAVENAILVPITFDKI